MIPAFKPLPELVDIVRSLSASPLAAIIVVDDGSPSTCKALFQEIGRLKKVIVLQHGVNLGKGAALKTGLNHAYCHFSDCTGVVTLDADGQHLVEDVLKVVEIMEANPENLIMGARAFDQNVPFRSKLGNTLTSTLFRVLVGQKLTDTQSGLRGIPMAFIPALLKIKATGYEYELDLLLANKYWGWPVIEQPITTVYLDANSSSHFNPFLDSMRIYFVLFRFTLAALLSAIIDSTIFMVAYFFTSNILGSQVSARMISMFFNYSAVKRAVFYSDQEHSNTFPKYLALVLVSGLVSYVLIRVLVAVTPLSILTAKLSAESLVFLANFAIQRDFIFVSSKKERS